MKTKKEIKDWLLENAVDEDGDLNLCELDFSDFDGNVFLDNMEVKGNLHQSGQEVKGSLFQNFQDVQKDLFQNEQDVKGIFKTQTLKTDEEYKIDENNNTYIVKKVKKHTLEELKKILGYDFEMAEKAENEKWVSKF